MLRLPVRSPLVLLGVSVVMLLLAIATALARPQTSRADPTPYTLTITGTLLDSCEATAVRVDDPDAILQRYALRGTRGPEPGECTVHFLGEAVFPGKLQAAEVDVHELKQLGIALHNIGVERIAAYKVSLKSENPVGMFTHTFNFGVDLGPLPPE